MLEEVIGLPSVHGEKGLGEEVRKSAGEPGRGGQQNHGERFNSPLHYAKRTAGPTRWAFQHDF